MLIQRGESEQLLNARVEKLESDRQSAIETSASLQRRLATSDAEKKYAERSAIKLHKDKAALKNTLDKVASQYLHFDAICTKKNI